MIIINPKFIDMDNSLSLFIVAAFAVIIIIPIIFNLVIKKIGRNKVKGNKNTMVNGENNSTVVTHIDTQNNYNGSPDTKAVIDRHEPSSSVDEIKSRIKILFVDDKDDFPIISMLRNNGYQVEYMDDITDIDAKAVRYADIIFLDINGVGVAMKFKNQGMGLCGALRDYYGDSKRLILYSGETEGSIFDKDAKKADATLPKDSDLFQFISYITQYGKELLEKTN